MTRPEPLQPRAGKAWRDQARELIHRLEDQAPKGYDGPHRLAPYSAQQSSPVNPSTGRPYDPRALDVIARPFEFRGGRIVLVRLQRPAFVALLRAMRDVPSIEVGFGSGYFATLRDWAMQAGLYANYRNGGPLAAPPGKTWHHRASVDLGVRSDVGRAAMLRHGFVDLLPQDPPHFTLGRRG